jgi:hypothetical protein
MICVLPPTLRMRQEDEFVKRNRTHSRDCSLGWNRGVWAELDVVVAFIYKGAVVC